MRSTRIIGVVVVAAATTFAVAASPASAEEFIASKTGKLAGHALNNQVYKLGKASVECKAILGSGTLTSERTPTLPTTLTSSGCAFEGFGPGEGVIGLADISFAVAGLSILSTNPEVGLTSPAKCKIVIPHGQSLGSKEELTYVNKGGKLEIKQKITGIAYEVTESSSELLCGKVGEKGSNGTLSGNIEYELEGGTLEVK